MGKHFRMAILLALIWLMNIPPAAAAGDIDWRIDWQEDGSLREEVRIEGTDIFPVDPNWQVSREAGLEVWHRAVQDWPTYRTLPDGLPLKVQQRNFLVWQQTVISIDPSLEGGLASRLKPADTLRLTISVPGIVISKTALHLAGQQASWDFPDSTAFLQVGRLARVIILDGLLFGISIVVLGVFWIGIKFRKQLKKAEQIIAEEYALPSQEMDPAQQQE